ncbi:MAG: BadF/BadG/BcrA/BcrD ATPase family protein [Thermoplasmataceae archaeon]|jgi:N-acetylglucosamine kinase-like BadF-type ATPase
MNFVSVDGGATKTLAACYSEEGDILGVGVAGPSNFRNIGVEKTKENLSAAVDKSLERSGLNRNDVSQFSFALAGVKDSKKSTEIIQTFIGEMRYGKKVMVLNDGEAGFNCRFPGKDGIIAAPGTGMIAYARRGSVFERSSGWGWFIGDEGGAFYTARRSIQESAKVFDGRLETESKIPEALLKYFNVTEPRQLVNEVYIDPIDIRKIAAFTKVISDYASMGDSLAISLLRESAKESAKCVIALKKRVFRDTDVEFSGYGGVYRAGDLYWKTLVESVADKYPSMTPVRPLYGYHAVIGSMYLIMSSLGVSREFDPDIVAKNLEKAIGKISSAEKLEFLLM